MRPVRFAHTLAVYVALLAAALLGAQQTLFQAFVREQLTSPGTVNRQCEAGRSESSDLNLPASTVRQLCVPLPAAQSVRRFVLFATDCWPVGEAADVLEHFKEHSVSYAIDIPGAKYSHAIWTSYLTGQLPTNYKGDAIQGDHLIKS